MSKTKFRQGQTWYIAVFDVCRKLCSEGEYRDTYYIKSVRVDSDKREMPQRGTIVDSFPRYHFVASDDRAKRAGVNSMFFKTRNKARQWVLSRGKIN